MQKFHSCNINTTYNKNSLKHHIIHITFTANNKQNVYFPVCACVHDTLNHRIDVCDIYVLMFKVTSARTFGYFCTRIPATGRVFERLPDFLDRLVVRLQHTPHTTQWRRGTGKVPSPLFPIFAVGKFPSYQKMRSLRRKEEC